MVLSLVRAHPRTTATLLLVQITAIATCLALQRPSGPVLYSDEMGFLAGAWNFSTREGTAVLTSSAFYSPGYSVVLAPFLSVSSIDAWVIAVVVNAFLATLVPLAIWVFTVENLRVEPRPAAAIALACGLYPALLIQASRAWPEVLLALVAAAWAIAMGRYLRNRTPVAAIVGGAVAGLSYAVHHRMAGVVAVTALAFIVGGWRLLRTSAGWSPDVLSTIRSEVSGLAAVGAGFIVSLVLDRLLIDRVYATDPVAPEQSVLDALAPSQLRNTAEHFVGHLWYAQIATLGLAAVATVSGIGRWRRRRTLDADLVVVAGFSATIAISAMFLSPYDRVDHMVYGRYAEIWAPILIAIGLAAVAQPVSAVRRAAYLSGYLTVGLASALTISVGVDYFRRPPNKMTVPAAIAWDLIAGDWNSDVTFELDFWPITAASVIAGLIVCVVAMRYRYGALAVGAVFVVLAIAVAALSYRPFNDVYEYTGVAEADRLREGGADAIGFVDGVPRASLKAVQYNSGFLPVVEVDPNGRCPGVRFLVAADDATFDFEARLISEIAPFGGSFFEATCS